MRSAYLQNVYNQVLARDPDQREFQQAVLEVLAHAQEPLAAGEVYRRVLAGEGTEKNRRTCLSTVYRTLTTLVEKGLLTLSLPEKPRSPKQRYTATGRQ